LRDARGGSSHKGIRSEKRSDEQGLHGREIRRGSRSKRMSGKSKKESRSGKKEKEAKAKNAKAKPSKKKVAAKSVDEDERIPTILGTDANAEVRCREGIIIAQKEAAQLNKSAAAHMKVMGTSSDEAVQLGAMKAYLRTKRDAEYLEGCIEHTNEQVQWLRSVAPKAPVEVESDDDEEDNDTKESSDTSEEAQPAVVRDELRKKLSRPKLFAPKKAFTGKEDWVSTYRWITVWHSDYKEYYTDEEIGRKLMDAISGEAETSVNATIQAGEESFSKIMQGLQKFYGKRNPQITAEKKNALTSHRRAGCKMVDFIREHTKRFAEANAVGESWSSATAGTKLLKAAELSVAQRSNLVSTLKTRDKATGVPDRNPDYDGVLEELWGLADSYAVADEMKPGEGKKTKKKDEESQALLSYGGDRANQHGKKKKGKGKGKGKKGKGKGKGKRDGKGGKEKKAFGAWQGGSQGGGKGKWWEKKDDGKGGGWEDKKAAGPGICHYYAKGEDCPYGEDCRFEHKRGDKSKKKEWSRRGQQKREADGGEQPRKRVRVADPDESE